MSDVGKLVFLLGLLLTAVGAVLWGLAKAGFRGLPGDLRYESPRLRIYVPIVSCIVLSILLTGMMWLWRWFGRR